MSIFRDITYLEHIRDSIAKIQAYTEGLSEETFQESTLIQDGVIRQFEIIGEASKQISDTLLILSQVGGIETGKATLRRK